MLERCCGTASTLAVGVRAITLSVASRPGRHETLRQRRCEPRHDAVDRKLRIGADAGREQRTVDPVQVVAMMMTAIGVRYGTPGVGAERTATHHVRTDDRRGQRLEGQGRDTCPRLAPVRIA